MRFGIITDLHGNIDALNVVLEEFDRLNVDKILNLGDMIGIGPFPNEVVEKIISLGDKVISVKGNHEGYFLYGTPCMVHGRPARDEEVAHHKWIHSLLSDKSKDFIRSLNNVETIDVCDKKIVIMHYPQELDGTYRKMYQYPDSKTSEELFNNFKGDIFLYGHTHNENVKSINDKYFINPGSTGCFTYHDYVSYGVLDVEKDKIDYSQHTKNYDTKKVYDDIVKLNYPRNELMRNIFFDLRTLYER